jgi:hypothetical protein
MLKRLLLASVMLLPMVQVDARPMEYEDLKAAISFMSYDLICAPGILSVETRGTFVATNKQYWSTSEIERANSEVIALVNQLGTERFCRMGDMTLKPAIPELNAKARLLMQNAK